MASLDIVSVSSSTASFFLLTAGDALDELAVGAGVGAGTEGLVSTVGVVDSVGRIGRVNIIDILSPETER